MNPRSDPSFTLYRMDTWSGSILYRTNPIFTGQIQDLDPHENKMDPINTCIIICCWSNGILSKAFWITRHPYICRARGWTCVRSWNRKYITRHPYICRANGWACVRSWNRKYITRHPYIWRARGWTCVRSWNRDICLQFTSSLELNKWAPINLHLEG